MSTRASVLGLTLAIALVWAPLIMAQGTQTGTVRGWVRDSQGLVLPGATVTVASDAMQGSRSTRVGAYQPVFKPCDSRGDG